MVLDFDKNMVIHMKIESEKRIEKMRNGEKIKCPRCKAGLFSAVGDPKTTKVFRCDTCETGMVLTVAYKSTKE